MSVPSAKDLAAFPDALRALIEAELGVGNTVVALASTFPAPPAGAWALLQHPVSTRARESSPGVHFVDRNSSHHAGEFCDTARRWFVLEPPRPPEPPPDMDAIREALAAREREANASRDLFY